MKKLALLIALNLCFGVSYSQTLINTIITNNELDQNDATASQRNQIGECDATCHVTAPLAPPAVPIQSQIILQAVIIETENETLTCQEAGYAANYIGTFERSRTYQTQNGVMIPGTYTPWVTTNNTCHAAAGCSGGARTWISGGYTCSGTLPAMTHNSNGVANNTATNRSGLAQYSCYDGVETYLSSTCNYVPNNCAAGLRTWTASGNTCSGNLPMVLHGANATLTNTVANQTGSATYSCNDGVLTQTSGTCLRSCLGAAVTWTAINNTCSGTRPTINHGDATVVNTSTAGFTGSINYSCNNGVLTPSGQNCNRVCAGGTLDTTGGYFRYAQFIGCFNSTGMSNLWGVPYYARTEAFTVPAQCPMGTSWIGIRNVTFNTLGSGNCSVPRPGRHDLYYNNVCQCNTGGTGGGPIAKPANYTAANSAQWPGIPNGSWQ